MDMANSAGRFCMSGNIFPPPLALVPSPLPLTLTGVFKNQKKLSPPRCSAVEAEILVKLFSHKRAAATAAAEAP